MRPVITMRLLLLFIERLNQLFVFIDCVIELWSKIFVFLSQYLDLTIKVILKLYERFIELLDVFISIAHKIIVALLLQFELFYLSVHFFHFMGLRLHLGLSFVCPFSKVIFLGSKFLN